MAYSAEAGGGEAVRVGLDALHPMHPILPACWGPSSCLPQPFGRLSPEWSVMLSPVHPSGTSATWTCLFLDLVPFSFSFRRSHGL